MDWSEELARAQAELRETREDLENSEQYAFEAAQRRAVLYARELLAEAVTIAGRTSFHDSRDELAIALDIVREQAQDVGLLRRTPPRSV
jgi:hypothetical protein